jgi:nicotinate-nucleotide adenylyltransferase
MKQKVEQLGVFGGTFNPVHHGHLILAREAKERLGLDRVILVPNFRSPLRQGEVLAPAENRLEMLRLALGDEPGMEVSDLEVRRGGSSYTVDTMEALKAELPEASLTFLCGADSLTTLDRWVRIERILELARVCVLARPGTEAEAAHADLIRRAPGVGAKIERLALARMIDLSATEIRERVAAGRSVRWMVPEAVGAHIRSESLYLDS